jgi:hypothetical protein
VKWLPTRPQRPTKASAAEVSEGLGIPYLELPVRVEPAEWDPSWGPKSLTPENEPTREQLDAFFKDSPDAPGRVVFCSEINNDLTDDWGHFGYSPGFIFVCGARYGQARTLSDHTFLENISHQQIVTPSGHTVPVLAHYDFFPRDGLRHQIINPKRTPATFEYLTELYGASPAEQQALPSAGPHALGSAATGDVVPRQ